MDHGVNHGWQFEHGVEEEAQGFQQSEKQRPHVTESPALPFLTCGGLVSFHFLRLLHIMGPPRNFRSLFSNIRCHFRASQGTRPRIPRKLLKMRNGDERQPLEPLHHTPRISRPSGKPGTPGQILQISPSLSSGILSYLDQLTICDCG